MENKLVIGILNIVEDKLREFGIMLPDDDREDSKDPIVGYQYAELHDRIKEFLEEQGVMEKGEDFVRPAEKVKVYGISIVNSAGFMNGNESYVVVRGSLQESLDYAYEQYEATWQELKDNGELRGSIPHNRLSFTRKMLEAGGVNIQLDDYHICFERFEWEVDVPKGLSVDAQIRDAAQRTLGESHDRRDVDLDFEC